MLNYSDKTLDKKERQIKEKYSPIMFDERIEVKSLNDLFDKLFQSNYCTYYADDKTIIQCSARRYRSYYDAYRLCMYYYPDLSFKDMYRKLRETLKRNHPINYKWLFYTCPDVGRAVLDHWKLHNDSFKPLIND